MKKFLLGTVSGVIILGILGTALWESFLKPLLNFVLIVCVNITTLGLKSLQNSIYRDIAKGLHEDVSLRIMILIYSFVFAFLTLTTIIFLIRKSKKDNKDREMKNYLKFKTLFDNKIFLMFYIIVVFIFFGLDLSRTVYINQVTTYYNQLKMIILPNITDDQSKEFDSNFSQINDATSYVKLTKELENIAINNDRILPIKPTVLNSFIYPSTI